MSVASCSTFLHDSRNSPELAQQMKSVTGVSELVALGRRHGYVFEPRDLATASSSLGGSVNGQDQPVDQPVEVREAAFYHYEFDLAEIPGLGEVLDELPHLKIKPEGVDLVGFDRAFRAEDLRSTSMSPADPDFQRWHENMVESRWRDSSDNGGDRRDFHLFNLDENVDHPGYENYFDAKCRTISSLEEFFGGEVRFSGSMWYPPSSYRLWHTNETQPGWRMYVVDLDEPFTGSDEPSFFRYMNPQTREIVTLPERPRIVRFFKPEQEPSKLFWHCIVNPSVRHRWSFGFVVPDNWKDRFSGLGRG